MTDVPDNLEAVNSLQQLGLTEYDARCFVALTQLPQGTAREISRVADIPRSRVYDSIDRLQSKGLVESQGSEPKVFRAVPIDTAVRILETEYQSYVDTMEDTLRNLEPTYKETDRGVWALEGHERVTERTLALINEAEEEIVLLAFNPDVLEEETLARLDEAAEDGLTVLVGTRENSIRERLTEEAPSVEVFTSGLIEWIAEHRGEHAIGRILVVDGEQVMTSATYGEELPGVPAESAVWSAGVDHGLAIILQQLIAREVDKVRS